MHSGDTEVYARSLANYCVEISGRGSQEHNRGTVVIGGEGGIDGCSDGGGKGGEEGDDGEDDEASVITKLFMVSRHQV